MKFWKKLELHWKIIIALFLGIIWSFIATGFFGGIDKSNELSAQDSNAQIISDDGVFTTVKFDLEFDFPDTNELKCRLSEGGDKIVITDIDKTEEKSEVTVQIPNEHISKKVQFFTKSSGLISIGNFTSDWVAPWGDIFIRLLKLIAIPLVLFSIIAGLASLQDASKIGRLGGKTIAMYIGTTFTSVIVGLLLVNMIQPGARMDDETRTKNRIRYELWAKGAGVELQDSKNLLDDPAYDQTEAQVAQMMEVESKQGGNEKVEKLKKTVGQQKDSGPLQFVVDMVPTNIFLALGDGKLMLQVIFFAIFFGISLILIKKETAEPVIKVVNGISEVFVKMVDLTMKAAPFFVFCLMAGAMSKMADTATELVEIFQSLAVYSLVVVIGLAFMAFLLYPLLIQYFAKIKYKDFFRKMAPAQFLAFSTSSSAATLPVTIECVEENVGVSRNVSSFVLPIGATINMDGTSLYQAVAVIFLAQMHDVDLAFADQITIVLTATLASIGAAAVPSAGLVMLMIVLESVGLNPAWIVFIFPIDRLLDMCRTVVNVTGDATVATIVAKSEGELNPKP